MENMGREIMLRWLRSANSQKRRHLGAILPSSDAELVRRLSLGDLGRVDDLADSLLGSTLSEVKAGRRSVGEHCGRGKERTVVQR